MRILVEVLFALYLYLAIKYPHFRPKFSWVSLGVILFTLSFIVSSIFGVNFYRSFWGTMERMGGLFTFLHFFTLFLMLASVFKKREDWLTLFRISVFVSITSVVYGFLQKGEYRYVVGSFGKESSVFGTIGNRAIFSGYLLFNIYFAIWLLIESLKDKAQKILSFKNIERLFYVLAILLNSAAIIFISVRGSALALFVSIFCLLIFLFVFREKLGFKRKLKLKEIFAFLLIGIVFFVFFNSFLIEKIPLFQRLASTSFKERNVEARLMVWQESLQAIKERPFFGWGPENFIIAYGKYFNPKIFIGPGTELIFDRAHNLFLDILASQGIAGLLIFLFLIASVLRFSLKTARKNGDNATFFAFPCLILAYFIHTSFIFDLIPTYLMLFYVFGLCAAMNGKQPAFAEASADAKALADRSAGKAGQILLVVLVSLALILAYFTNIRPAIADYTSTQGAIDLGYDNYSSGFDKFKKALQYNTHIQQDILMNFINYYISAIYRLEGKIAEKNLAKDLKELEKELEKMLEKFPDDYNLYLFSESVYLAEGSFIDPEKYLPKAEEVLKKALERYPHLHYFYQRLAYIKSLQKDYDSALDYVFKSYEANPEFPGAKYLLGRTYVLKGEKGKGFDLMTEAIVNGNFRKEGSIIWLAMRLADEKEHQRLVYLYKRLSLDEPKYLTQLAYSYHLWAKKNEAIETADKAFALDDNVLGLENLKVLKEIYESWDEKDKASFASGRIKSLSPAPRGPKEIFVPIELPY